MDFEKEITEIKDRNARVERDKAWETSMFRKIFLSVITYVVAALILFVIGVPNFYLGALVPAFGFLLSTLSLPFVKSWWLKRNAA